MTSAAGRPRVRTRPWLALGAALLALGVTGSVSGSAPDPAQAQSSGPRVASRVTALVEIKRGFTRPVYVTNAHDARLFVVEQDGRIKVLKKVGTVWTVPATPFLDIHNLMPVPRGGDQGLLGLAFHPQYQSNGRFFVYYTNRSGDNVVAEYHRHATNPDRADATTRRTVLKIPHTPPGTQHNAGHIAFGPNDGYLYIGTGDGKGGGLPDEDGNAQNVGSLLGKILRIDITPSTGYAIPVDNPHAAEIGDARLVWSVGLRNPWRWSFDRLTGKLWIGDVGFKTYEEVSRSATGRDANFGWRCYEGRHQLDEPGVEPCEIPDRVVPVVEYAHGNTRCSVTGGYVYRGMKQASLVGRYLFTDFCTGELWDIAANAANPATLPTPFASGMNISSFGEDQNGEVFVTDLYAPGAVYRVKG